MGDTVCTAYKTGARNRRECVNIQLAKDQQILTLENKIKGMQLEVDALKKKRDEEMEKNNKLKSLVAKQEDILSEKEYHLHEWSDRVGRLKVQLKKARDENIALRATIPDIEDGELPQ